MPFLQPNQQHQSSDCTINVLMIINKILSLNLLINHTDLSGPEKQKQHKTLKDAANTGHNPVQ